MNAKAASAAQGSSATCDALVADRHPLFSLGLASLLRDAGYEQVTVLPPGDEDILAAAKRHGAALLIVGEESNRTKGADIFAALRQAGDDRPVILLTENAASARTLAAIKSGINGLLPKDASVETIRECLREVREGRRWIDRRHLQSALAQALGTEDPKDRFAGLTDRERQVVNLVTENLSNAEIADRLGISTGTVKVHCHNIYSKLGLDNRVNLMLMAREEAG